MKSRCLLLILIALSRLLPAADAAEAPPTLMTLRGKALYSEDFAGPFAPSTGKPKGFASGFLGWRYNGGPKGGRGGRWELVDGTFHGMETPEANHPATASYGILYQDFVAQVDVRFNDVPLEGRKYRSVFLKSTDEKDYVVGLFLSPGGLSLVPYSVDRINPQNKQRDKDPQVSVPLKLNLGEWHTVLLEIRGTEVVATVAGRSVTLNHPLVGAAKQSLMLGVGVDASFRKLRLWEALPNPEWERNKAALLAANKVTKK